MKDIYLGIEIPPRPIAVNEPVKTKLFGLKLPEDYALTETRLALRDAILTTSGLTHIGPINESNPNIAADLSFPCHTLSKTLKKSPQIIAEELSSKISVDLVETSKAERGYLNFGLSRQKFGKTVVEEVLEEGNRYGRQNSGEGKTVVIDYSSPNIAKFMSLGHLRSTVIGESLARIYRANGYEVVTDNHLGDWGTQFGMLGRAYELWGKDFPELETDPVKGLYLLYVKIHDEVEKEKHILGKDKETPLEKDGRAWFRRLENGDTKAKELLEWSTSLSLKEFQRVYDALGTKFDYQLGESAYVPMIPSVMSKLQETGVATIAPDGAVVSNLTKPGAKGKDELVLIKRDGASVYATRDMATLIARDEWFDPEKIIYVVGTPQEAYFKQVFETYRRFTDGKGPEVEHVGFGQITLPEGKMSTRAGRVVFLEDVLNQAIETARERVDKSPNKFSAEQKDQIAKQVGVGAMIYFDLGQNRERDIKYDSNKALQIEGQSAPYIQYAYARTGAMATKAAERGLSINPNVDTMVTTDSEFALVKELAKYPEAVRTAMLENQPSKIAQSVYQIADAYNQFYKHDRILGTEEPVTTTRLRLTHCAGQVIKNGLELLSIEAPARM